jgi:hypothetical protein
MITIDGKGKIVPMTKINVDTPYFVGEIEAKVPKNLICDVIIGIITGVKDVTCPRRKNKEISQNIKSLRRTTKKRDRQESYR